MSDPAQDSTSAATPEPSPTNDATPAGAGARSSAPKWIAAMAVIAVIAAGAGWFAADRSTTEDLGEPVADDASTADTPGDEPTADEAELAAKAEEAAAEAADAAGTPSWLFSLTATGGTFSANELNPNIGTLTLTGTSTETTGFTDRPIRDAVTFGTDKLPTAWPEMFADSDPNAVLIARDADGIRQTYVLELSSPTIDGTALTFQVAAVEGKDHSSQLPGMTTRAATVPLASFGEVALFIDSVTPPGPHWICTSGSNGSGTQITPPAPIPFDSWTSQASNQFEAQCWSKKGQPSVIGTIG
ncbi:MAG: hypothetical protein ACK4V6_07010 [Microthrixaceae bacterium]